MVTPNEIRNAKFEVVFRGYKPEDVDALLERTAQELEASQKELAELRQELDDADQDRSDYEKKLKILASKIEDYRDEEETLKMAMINAQRMGESILKEAKQKAEEILRKANIQAEDREQRANDEVKRAANEMKQLQKQVGRFKANVLNLYKKHIESLSALQSYDEAPDREADRQAAFETEDDSPALVNQIEEARQNFLKEEAPKQEPAQEKTAPAPDPTPAAQPAAEEEHAVPLIQMNQEEEQDPPVNQLAQEEEELPSVFDGFKGISFDD